ncbi:MAG: hypothetical protein KIG36_05455 [Eubacteriales bacterium]|nr:hypothetical protein [Eubacteriales bacterium]
MENPVTILIDTQGGDRGPGAAVRGAALALEKFPLLRVVLAGERAGLERECAAAGMDEARVRIFDAPDCITAADDPAAALFHKTDSSMLGGLAETAARGEIFGMVTCGCTRVLLPAAMRYLSGPERVRPALAALLPAQTGIFTCVVDAGATVDCSPAMLVHFAHLGSALMKRMYGVGNPRVGLLSNGAEPTKGNKLVRETHALLAAEAADGKLDFVGNIEGSNALSGECDVLVCDGFAGNLVLKVTEGTAKRLMTDIVRYARSRHSEEIAALAAHLMSVYDIGSLGGGLVLGVSKPVVKARGSADEQAFVNISEMLINMAANRAAFDQRRIKI